MKTKNLSLYLLLTVAIVAGGYIVYNATAPKQTIISYTTTDGNVIDIHYTDISDPSPISNTYSNGKGIMVFEGKLTYIWQEAFSSNETLKSIIIPEGVEYIEANALSHCPSLTDVTLPNSLTSLHSGAFMECTSLNAITIPKSVTSITAPFIGCSALTRFEGELASPDGRCLIIDHQLTAFAPGGLTKYKIPANLVHSIRGGAFYGCSSLKQIEIPFGITYIGAQAFEQCTELEKITIPDTVTSIEFGAFSMCKSLTHIYLPQNLVTLGTRAFAGCVSLFTIAIPNKVKEISSFTFSGCTSLLSVSLPRDLTTIGSYAFQNCPKMIMLTIPSKVESIDKHALGFRSYIRSIRCEAKIPPKGGNQLFGEHYSNIIIQVPADSYEAYKTSPDWQQLSNRLQAANL